MPASKPKIVCIWELGDELGHVSRLHDIAQKLQPQFDVYFILKDLSRSHPFTEDTDITVFQAPVWLPKMRMQRPIACLADTLLLKGYLEANTLHSLVTSWRNLLALIQPNLIIFDYAPTAMLAALDLSIPKISIGTGFADPAPGHPIADWRALSTGQPQQGDQLIAQQETNVLNSINGVGKKLGLPALTRLSDLFQNTHTLLNTYPCFDLYEPQRSAPDVTTQVQYCLTPLTSNHQKKAQFPDSANHKVLAYLKPHHPQFPQLIEALALCKSHCIVACPFPHAKEFKKHENPTLQIHFELIDLIDGLEQADVFIGHGNMSSICESLQLHTPTMVLPIQLEQLITGKSVVKNAVGEMEVKIESPQALADKIDTLAQNTTLKQNAAQFSKRFESQLSAPLPETVAELCEQALLA